MYIIYLIKKINRKIDISIWIGMDIAILIVDEIK